MGTIIQFILGIFGKSIKKKVMDAIMGNILGGGGSSKSQSSQNDGGMLGSVMEKFKEKGLGNIFNSWVGNGPNMAVSPDQIRDTLGDDKLQEMSQKTGMNMSDLSAQIAKYLPGMVDKMTPNGKLPGQ